MVLERFAAAEAELAAGRRDEGIRLTIEQLTLDPDAPIHLYRNLTALLIRHKMYAEAGHWADIGSQQYPHDYNIWNNLGVALRRLHRYDDAIAALTQCQKIDPKNLAAQINLGNVYNDMRDGPNGVSVWSKLVKSAPANSEYQRGLGRGNWHCGDLDKAEMRLRLATKLKPDFLDAWLDLITVTAERGDTMDSMIVFDQALAAMPNGEKLYEAKAVMLKRANRSKEAEAFLTTLIPRFDNSAWLHLQIGSTVSEWDRGRAHRHMERAIALEPENWSYQLTLAESLSRTRGPAESHMLEQSYVVLKKAIDHAELTPSNLKVATEILTRLADFDAADALCDFTEMGRKFAESGKHTALLAHLSRVKTPEDRVELVEQHKIWGDLVLVHV